MPDDAAERVGTLPWYHCIELAPGLVTPGMFDLRPYVHRYGLPSDLSGLRALDVGTYDGFWAFEMERRGAEVVGIDVDSSAQYDWPRRLRPAEPEPRGETWRLAAEVLGSRAERVGGITAYEATPERLGGAFDLVLCGSILIHLRDPVLALERLAALCRGRLVLCEEYSRTLDWLPRVRAVEFRGDSPHQTWWRPTRRTWRSMLETAGFEQVSEHDRFAMRFADRSGAVPHVVLHARGSAPA